MEDIVSYALNIASKMDIDYAEVRYQSDVIEEVLMRNGIPETPSINFSKGISIRLLASGGIGFSSVNVIDKRAIREAVVRAFNIAKVSANRMKKKVSFSNARMGKANVIVKPRIKPENIDVSSRIDLLKSVDDVCMDVARDLDVKLQSRILELGFWITEKFIMNTDGACIRSQIPRVTCSYTLTASKGERGSIQRHEDIGEVGGWERVERWILDEKVPDEVLKLSKILSEGEELKDGVYDVILGPELVGIICHESVGHPFEADRVLGREAAQGGETYVKPEMLKKEIGAECVTVVDDPRLPNSFGYYLYDEEGVEARERVLIDRGVLNELLHNRQTAAEFGVESNGSSRASFYDMEPLVRMANTYMKPGEFSIEELLEDVKDGIWIKSYTEWNIDDKRWNQRYVGLEAYRILNGKVSGIVRDPVLEITTKTLFESIDAVGKDLKFYAGYCGKGDPMQSIPVWFGGPSIRLRSIRIRSRNP